MKLAQQGFRFVQALTTVLFDEVENIRNSSDQLDKAVAEYFQTPGLVAAIGAGVDPNIPRLQYPSKFGHSLLNISNVAAQLVTNIDQAWEKDFDKIAGYCVERESSLEKVLSTINAKVKWVGWSIKVQKSVGKPAHSDNSAAQLIKKHFFKDDATVGQASEPYEISHKFAFVEGARFFVNFHCSNYKVYSHQVQVKPNEKIRIVNPSLRDLKFEDQGIEFFLDINSKYSFDLGASPQHKADDFTKIVQTAKTFLEDRLGGRTWS